MVAYNFQERFADDVESGRKRQTIRPRRKRQTRSGDELQLYTGMRTKKCRKLRDAICNHVTFFRIGSDCLITIGRETMYNEKDTARQAKLDGFTTVKEMIEFFEKTYGLPFTGELIDW